MEKIFNFLAPSKLRKYVILVPGLTNKVVDGIKIGLYLNLQDFEKYEADKDGFINYLDKNNPKRFNYIYIPELKHTFRSSPIKDQNIPAEIEVMPFAYDSLGTEIKEGNKVYFANVNRDVSILEIEKIDFKQRRSPYYGHGELSYETTLHGMDLITKRRTRTSFPEKCIKI